MGTPYLECEPLDLRPAPMPEVLIVGMSVQSANLGLGVVAECPKSMDTARSQIAEETGCEWPYVRWFDDDGQEIAGLANPWELTAIGFADREAKVA